jgi:L-alanine-DL-glutamate epimerase-like enolase superfamily enzyme
MKIQIKTVVSKLEFRFPFSIAHGTRTSTDVVLVRLECDGLVGRGEATLPPYLEDNVQTVLQFFSRPELKELEWPQDPIQLWDQINEMVSGVMPGKAALDMAVWELFAASKGISLQQALGILPKNELPHTYTIGVCDKHEMDEKLQFGLKCGFQFFKLKLDGKQDERIVNDFRSLTQLPFAVDANQSWENIDEAIELSQLLMENGCMLIEQPFHKSDLVKTSVLKQKTSLPLIADEACQSILDIPRLTEAFDGINLKLQKCGGITPAMRMIEAARKWNLKVLVGCMSESSIGCNAAEALASLCDWADLDGPFLIKNDQEMRDIIA